MTNDEVVLSQRRGRVDISRPVDERLRRVAGIVGAVAVAVGFLGLIELRPSILEPREAIVFFACAVAITAGLICLSFALWGGEWVVSFEAATGTVREELRAFGNLAVVHGFQFEDLGGLRAIPSPDGGGYRLFMLEAENGRPFVLGDFADETAMACAARAITAVHPGLRVG